MLFPTTLVGVRSRHDGRAGARIHDRDVYRPLCEAGAQLRKERLQSVATARDDVVTALAPHQDAAFRVLVGISRVDPDSVEVGHLEQKREVSLEALRGRDDNLIAVHRDRRLSGHRCRSISCATV